MREQNEVPYFNRSDPYVWIILYVITYVLEMEITQECML